MPRLLHPGLGDLMDRASILALKLQYGRKADKVVGHFEEEAADVLAAIQQIPFYREIGAQWGESLFEANHTLWKLTDELRTYIQDQRVLTPVDVAKAAKLGMQIMLQNDHRSRLVAGIDKAAGTHRGEEKLL